jgi:hypothetical protein
LGAKELLIISVRGNEKGSLSKQTGSYSMLFKLIGELLEDALTKSDMRRNLHAVLILVFPWFAL